MVDVIGYEGLFIIGVFFASIFIIISSIGLIILRGIGLKKLILNNNLGEDKVILGFIPIISDYLVSEVTTGKKDYKENTLGSITFVTGIASVIFGVLTIVYSISYLILCHGFFKAVNPEKYVLLNIVNVITFGSFSYIYIFIKRDFIFNYNYKDDLNNNEVVIEKEQYTNNVNLSKEI